MHRTLTPLGLALSAGLLLTHAVSSDPTPQKTAGDKGTWALWVQRVNAVVDKEYGSLAQLYQQLHANPELAFEEVQTAARMAKELKALGFEVTTGVGGTGVVGVLKNGNGPTVLVRTDL